MARKKQSAKHQKSNKVGYLEGLKTEWNLFWQTILGEDENPESSEIKDPFITGRLEVLTLDQVKAITKALSSDRKVLNQRLEVINKELEENTAKLESLKLVGGDVDEASQKINELSDLGQSLSEQLDRINNRLKIARSREDEIKKAQKSL
jgi:hypothetical protein